MIIRSLICTTLNVAWECNNAWNIGSYLYCCLGMVTFVALCHFWLKSVVVQLTIAVNWLAPGRKEPIYKSKETVSIFWKVNVLSSGIGRNVWAQPLKPMVVMWRVCVCVSVCVCVCEWVDKGKLSIPCSPKLTATSWLAASIVSHFTSKTF